MDILLLVDIQNDFLPNGALAVQEGDRIIPIVNQLMEEFNEIYATKDWHPPTHLGLVTNHKGKKTGDIVLLEGIEQILWPVHCIQNTYGSEFAKELNQKKIQKVIYKGTHPRYDSYSSFFDNGKVFSTELHSLLQKKGVDTIYLAGLATDYCVKFTALDAVDLGYTVYLILDACRGINLRPTDIEQSVEEMQKKGVLLTDSQQVLEQRGSLCFN